MSNTFARSVSSSGVKRSNNRVAMPRTFNALATDLLRGLSRLDPLPCTKITSACASFRNLESTCKPNGRNPDLARFVVASGPLCAGICGRSLMSCAAKLARFGSASTFRHFAGFCTDLCQFMHVGGPPAQSTSASSRLHDEPALLKRRACDARRRSPLDNDLNRHLLPRA